MNIHASRSALQPFLSLIELSLKLFHNLLWPKTSRKKIMRLGEPEDIQTGIYLNFLWFEAKLCPILEHLLPTVDVIILYETQGPTS